MESVGLLSLPVEMIHNICSYLRAEDVLALSHTCHYLKVTLNDNSVWEKYLQQHKHDLSDLLTRDQRVEPKLPFSDYDHLCESRRLYMAKTRLLNNWRGGHFDNFVVKPYYWCGLYSSHGGDWGYTVFEESYFFVARFINDVQSDAIEVYNIDKTPVLHTTIPIENVDYKCFFLINTYLVVVEHILVHVYHITVPDKIFPLLYSFSIVADRINDLNIPDDDGLRVSWNHSAADNYLIASGWESNTVHIWDICNAVKVGAFSSPVDCKCISFLSREGTNWFFHHFTDSIDNYFCIFNMDEQKYLNTYFTYQNQMNHVIFHNSTVILFKMVDWFSDKEYKETVCSIYDFNTSILHKERQFCISRRNYQLNKTILSNGVFVILSENCFLVIDARTLDTVSCIPCKGLDFISYQVNMFGSLFVIACNTKKWIQEVWDIQKKVKTSTVFGVNDCTCFHISTNFTKVLTKENYSLNLFNFW